MRALAGFRIIINCAAVSFGDYCNFSLSFLLSPTALHFTCNSARLKVDRESNSHLQGIQSWPGIQHLVNLLQYEFNPQMYEENDAAFLSINYRDALKGGPQVAWGWLKQLRFVYHLQAGECNFFTSYSQNLGSILLPVPVYQWNVKWLTKYLYKDPLGHEWLWELFTCWFAWSFIKIQEKQSWFISWFVTFLPKRFGEYYVKMQEKLEAWRYLKEIFPYLSFSSLPVPACLHASQIGARSVDFCLTFQSRRIHPCSKGERDREKRERDPPVW